MRFAVDPTRQDSSRTAKGITDIVTIPDISISGTIKYVNQAKDRHGKTKGGYSKLSGSTMD